MGWQKAKWIHERIHEMAGTAGTQRERVGGEGRARGRREKAAEAMRLQAKVDAEGKALIERLQRPSGVSDDEALRRVKVIIERAVNKGCAQVRVYRFPNSLCTDRGRVSRSAGARLRPAPSQACQGKCTDSGRVSCVLPVIGSSFRSSISEWRFG